MSPAGEQADQLVFRTAHQEAGKQRRGAILFVFCKASRTRTPAISERTQMKFPGGIYEMKPCRRREGMVSILFGGIIRSHEAGKQDTNVNSNEHHSRNQHVAIR